jgi:hypothetical protein
MAGISSVGGPSLPPAQFQAEYAARAAKLQKDAIDQQGDLALKLINSASSGTGQQIDIRV